MYMTHTIGYMLHHIAAQLEKQSDQMLQEQLGIGFSQFKILRSLESYPHTKQRDIASSLGQTEASISRQIKLMIEDGILRSTVCPTNHREHMTMVTPKGIRLTEAATVVLMKCCNQAFAGLSDKQRESLGAMLVMAHDQVCMPHPDPCMPTK